MYQGTTNYTSANYYPGSTSLGILGTSLVLLGICSNHFTTHTETQIMFYNFRTNNNNGRFHQMNKKYIFSK